MHLNCDTRRRLICLIPGLPRREVMPVCLRFTALAQPLTGLTSRITPYQIPLCFISFYLRPRVLPDLFLKWSPFREPGPENVLCGAFVQIKQTSSTWSYACSSELFCTGRLTIQSDSGTKKVCFNKTCLFVVLSFFLFWRCNNSALYFATNFIFGM